MKKFLLLAILAVTAQLVNAQDLKKVNTSYLIKRFEDAKTEIDKVMADPKQQGKPEAYYWKATIYAELYQDPKLREKYPNAVKEADEAFKKYIESDASLSLLKTKGAEGVFAMYRTSYQTGVKSFNEKKWAEAASNFKMAVEYSDMIFANKWSNVNIAFDTTSILYLAYSNQNASNAPEAAKYYSRLADNKVGGDNYLDIYKYLVDHFITTKDEANFKKYIAIAKELYPKYNWEVSEIDYMDHNMTLAEKTQLYDKEDAAGTLSEIKYLEFGDIFVNAHHKDKSLDTAKERFYNLKGVDAYKKAFGKNTQNGIAAFNVGVIYYNFFGEYDDQYAANIRTMQGLNADRPVEKDPKKKAASDAAFKLKLEPYKKANADMEKVLTENLDLSIEWLEKSYTILKANANRNSTEKSVINKTVDFLANMFAYKRDKMRGKDLKAMDAFDAKYKEYDALHGKF